MNTNITTVVEHVVSQGDVTSQAVVREGVLKEMGYRFLSEAPVGVVCDVTDIIARVLKGVVS